MQVFPASSTDAYKSLARTWAATVTVVTAHRTEGSPALDGFTATAFLTVSMAPPIIVVSVTAASAALTVLRECTGFAVNFLAPSQIDLGNAFARPHTERAALWDQLPWSADEHGAPILGGVVGAFSAKLRQLVDAGDHVLVLGDVTQIRVGEQTDTLVYHNRGYGHVAR